MSYDQAMLRRIVEGALLAAGEALTVERLLGLFEDHERPEKLEIEDALRALQIENQSRGFELVEVASGWRYQVAQDLAYWVNRLWEEKPQKYSRALLETLSLIAYRQPITRSDIEEVRGVAVNSHIIKTLAEREWIKVVGHRDIPGRPSLFATTRQFLDYFGLKSLEELPMLSDLKDFDSLNETLELDDVAEEQEQIADVFVDEALEADQEDDIDEDRNLSLAQSVMSFDENIAALNAGDVGDQADWTGTLTDLSDDSMRDKNARSPEKLPSLFDDDSGEPGAGAEVEPNTARSLD